MKKIISKVFTILMVACVVWVGFSYIDTITHNDPASDNYLEYSEINLFVHLFD
jgi:hypothetical protein